MTVCSTQYNFSFLLWKPKGFGERMSPLYREKRGKAAKKSYIQGEAKGEYRLSADKTSL